MQHSGMPSHCRKVVVNHSGGEAPFTSSQNLQGGGGSHDHINHAHQGILLVDDFFSAQVLLNASIVESNSRSPLRSFTSPYYQTKVNFPFQTTEQGFENIVEKRSPLMGRNAQWKSSSRVDSLPRFVGIDI